MVQIIYYRNKCIGCNACVEVADNRWRISQRDGKCVLIDGVEKKGIYIARVNVSELPSGLQAAASCPIKCIQVRAVIK